MGLFGSKTKYYVSSQIYNMAGDFNERPSYMKSLVVQSALLGDDVAQRIQRGTMMGPGLSLRSFQKWANVNYKEGLPIADVTVDEVASLVPIRDAIIVPSGSPAGTYVSVINAVITERDAEIWVEKFLIENHPQLFNLNWTFEQDDVSDVITISFGDNHSDISFTPANWVQGAKYIAARYVVINPITEGPNQTKGSFGPYRSIESLKLGGYAVHTDTALTPIEFTLTAKETRRTEYKDSRPGITAVVSDSQVVSHTPHRIIYRKDENQGYISGTNTPLVIRKEKRVENHKVKHIQFSRETIEYSDRIETITIENEVLLDEYKYNYFEKNRSGPTMSNQKVFIYRMGSGRVALDNMQVRTATAKEFFPVIPLRIDNRFINEYPYLDWIYPQVSKAYKRGFGSTIDEMVEQLADNESIDDIDFALMVFGVHINEKSKAGKRYIYEFLKGLITYQNTSKTEWEGYQGTLRNQNEPVANYLAWDYKMEYKLDTEAGNRPPLPQYPPPKRTSLRIDAKIPGLDHYDITLSWSYIAETIHTGFAREGAKVGEIWFADSPTQIGNPQHKARTLEEHYRTLIQNTSNKGFYILYQVSKTEYRKLEVIGLEHSNYVYANKSVITSAREALNENTEESPFFFPMHYPTLKKLSPAMQNELGYCSKLLLLNSYQKVKVRWYQRGIFRFVFAIAILAVSFVVLGPASFASAPGVLGTNIAVGTALGLVGMAAVLAGAAANMVAAMIMMALIQKGAVELLGDKWGPMIAAIASVFAMQIGTQYSMTGSFKVNWNTMFQPQNIMRITDAVGRGYTGYVQGRMNDMMQGYETASLEYKEEMEMIEGRVNEILGQGAWIDPMLLTDLTEANNAYFRESSNSFISRTLLTGSDIAEISLALISEFPTVSLALDKPIM